MKILIKKIQQTWDIWFPSKMTFPQWYWYMATTLEDKVNELYENGTLNEIEDRYFTPYISPTYNELLWETDMFDSRFLPVREYNQLMIKVADSYIEKTLTKYLERYLANKESVNVGE